jgi:hypothetical protein
MPNQPKPLTAFEQTRRSWAQRIESPAELPPAFRGLFDPDRPLPYAVLTPTYEGFLRRLNAKLAWCTDDTLTVAEQTRDRLTTTVFPFAALDFLELGCVLLKSWLSVAGAAAVTLEFNTVTDYLFTPIVDAIRGIPMLAERPASRGHGAVRGTQPQELVALRERDVKLAYYAWCSVPPGDDLQAILYQGAARYGALARSVPAHATLLTGRELILIRDAPGGQRYGSVRTFIPLDRLAGAALEERRPGAFTLKLCLRGGGILEATFAAANVPAVRDLVAQLPR